MTLNLQRKREDNTRVGLVLAATGRTGLFFAETNKILSRLSKEWTDRYISWNFVFVAAVVPMLLIGKLMISSISCIGNMCDSTDRLLILRRAISLAVSLMHV